MTNSQKNSNKLKLAKLFLISIACNASYAIADLKMKPIATLPQDVQMQAPAAVQLQQSSPTTKPSAVPVNNLPNATLPNNPAALPSNGVQMQKAPMALPQAGAPAAPASRDMQIVKPVGSVGLVQTIQINNKKWEDVQNLPDSTVLITPDGQRATVGDVKQYKQQLSKNNSANAPIALKSKMVKLQVKNNKQLLNVKSILTAENAAATSAITAAPTRLSDKVSGLVKNCNPCITVVNGKGGSRVVFTPGTADSAAKYTITGGGFGAQVGEVYLTGGFNKRPTLRVDGWRDDQITAYFAAGLTGELDRNDVKLVVKLPNGTLVESNGNAKFIAARAQTNISLDKIPGTRVNVESVAGLDFQKTGNAYEFKQDPKKQVNIDWRGYTDTIDVTPAGWLKPGFEAVYAEANIEQYGEGSPYVSDKGCRGSTHTNGTNELNWSDDGNKLIIKRPLNQLSLNPMSVDDVTRAGAEAAAAAAANYLTFGAAGATGAVTVNTDCIKLNRRNYHHAQVSNILIMLEGPAGISPF